MKAEHPKTFPLAPGTSIDVSAGLVFRKGKLLITQRNADAHLGGLWEFPGGKRESHETFEQCLERELMEELGVQVRVGILFENITHDYPDKTVHLKFFLCEIVKGEPRALGCKAIQWVDKLKLGSHEFPAADARLLDRLRASDLWLR